MYRTHRLLLAIASAEALLLSTPAGAGQASTSFQVTATVGAACTLSAPDLAFGTYTTGAAAAGQTAIGIDCGGTPAVGTLTLSSSTGFTMTGGTGGVLSYDLYLDATHAQEILSGQDFPVTGVSQVTIFGEIPAGQAVEDGNYSDTVSVVFNF